MRDIADSGLMPVTRYLPGATMGGIRVSLIKKLCSASKVTVPRAMRILGLSEEEARPVLAALTACKVIEYDGLEGIWRSTYFGHRLRVAELRRGLTHNEADEIFAAVTRKAHAFNADDQFALRIVRVTVLGSYFTDGDQIVDLELLVDTRPRKKARKARRSGKGRRYGITAMFVDLGHWGKVINALREVSPAISFSEPVDTDREDHMVIFSEADVAPKVTSAGGLVRRKRSGKT